MDLSTFDRAVMTQALLELATEQARQHGATDPLVRMLVDHAELGVMPAGIEVLAALQWRHRHAKVS